MNRVCPHCKQDLGTTGNYFCYSCGQKLPNELTTVDVRINKYGSVVPEFTTKDEFDKKAIMKAGKSVLIVVLIIAVVGGGYFFLAKGGILNRIPTSINEQPGKVKNDRVLTSSVNLPQATFGERGLSSFVPSTADVYVEGKDLPKLIDELTNLGDDAALLGTSFKVSQISDLIEPQYAIFSKTEKVGDTERRVWGMVSKSRNDEVIRTLVEATKEATWSARLIDGYVVVSDSDELFAEVEDSKDKVILNLTLNSKYASAKNSLPAQGKLFMLLLTDTAQDYLAKLKEGNFVTTKFGELVDVMLSKDKTSYVVN